MTIMVCAACGTTQDHNTIRCEQCGKPLVFAVPFVEDAMICEACHGEGFVHGRDPKSPGLTMLPCLECNCSGIASCCDAAGSHPDYPTTRTPLNYCLNCGKKIDAGSPVEKGAWRPGPGDIAICLRCAHVHIYDNDLMLRQPTDDEVVEIAGDPEMVKAVNMIGLYNRTHKQ